MWVKTRAAVVIQNDRSDKRILSKPVGKISNNFEGELVGINLGLNDLLINNVMDKRLLFMIDCKPAILSSFSNNITKKYKHISMQNKILVNRLQRDSNNEIHAIWVPGHTGVELNELADGKAKEEAKKAQFIANYSERNILNSVIKEKVLVKWQLRVNFQLSDHIIFTINNRVNEMNIVDMQGIHLLFQLISGHNKLNTQQQHWNPNVRSENCRCGHPETVNHFIFRCQRYTRQRYKWQSNVSKLTGNIQDLKYFPLSTLSGQSNLPQETNNKLLKCMIKFIVDTRRFDS